MAISTSIRPRGESERDALHRLLIDAPRVVGIGAADDGWLTAALSIGGRSIVWCNDADPEPAKALLQRLGLPPMVQMDPEAIITAQLQLDRTSTPGFGPLPSPQHSNCPLVSILICTYNRAQWLPQALATARMQSWPHEIVVVNDGSTDETQALLDAETGIRVIHQENTGKPGALDAALNAAKGEAVLVLDDDDALLPGALHVLGRALFDHPELSCVIGDSLVFADGSEAPKRYAPAMRNPGQMAARSVIQQVPGLPGASLIRMSHQRQAGAYDPKLIRGQDMDMYLRLASVAGIESIPFPTFRYRSHDALRGSAAGQWNKSDRDTHKERFFEGVKPTFLRRYQAVQDGLSRAEAHAWAMGLHLRQCTTEARSELSRWSGPYHRSEAWIREQVGLPSELIQPSESVLIVDDGDPGALEQCLMLHAQERDVWVNLEVPRDPLGSVRLYWPGNYGARERLTKWFNGPFPIHLRLSSAPLWTPPPLDTLAWLPSIPAPEAIQALASSLGWTPPESTRPGLISPPHPVAEGARSARAAITNGSPTSALKAILPILETCPRWPGAWKLITEAYLLMGDERRAQAAQSRFQSALPPGSRKSD